MPSTVSIVHAYLSVCGCVRGREREGGGGRGFLYSFHVSYQTPRSLFRLNSWTSLPFPPNCMVFVIPFDMTKKNHHRLAL